MINRILYKYLVKEFFKGKIIILIGPRQVGKTTLLRKIEKKIKVKSLWLNADESDIKNEFNNANTSTELLQLIGKETKLVIIDEAQQIENIGLKLKLLHDSFPKIQIIATGSSAFDLQDATNEALTGRKRTYQIFPISFEEIVGHTSLLEAKRLLETRIIYGSYPEVINQFGDERKVLTELADSYLYKDILRLEGIRKPKYIEKLVRALALQLGSEVSFNELARTIGNIDVATVEKYIHLLEKAFIIFELSAYSRNLRNEIKKGKKYYFYDTGVRNAIINNFASLNLRTDKGALWENFLINERMKFNSYHENYTNRFFWRTKDQAEIDYIEEIDGTLFAYEFKWQKEKSKLPNSFNTAYPQNAFKVINKNNFKDFIL
ncbi:MAG: ATPase [Ignavibacteriae bacterium]|nr:MAG: ATPase [Ignavibacteriota bacterium]